MDCARSHRIQGLHAQAKPPAYFVSDITEVTLPTDDFRGQYISRTEIITALDIIRFDSIERNPHNNNEVAFVCR